MINRQDIFTRLTPITDKFYFKLSTAGQEGDGDELPPVEPPPSLTPAEEVDVIMDHNIEVESNQRIRKENVNIWTLTFKQPEMEIKVL